MSDLGPEAIGKGCKQLIRLELADCEAVTGAGLEAISDGCKQLIYPRLSNSTVTEEGVAQVRAALPACEVQA